MVLTGSQYVTVGGVELLRPCVRIYVEVEEVCHCFSGSGVDTPAASLNDDRIVMNCTGMAMPAHRYGAVSLFKPPNV